MNKILIIGALATTTIIPHSAHATELALMCAFRQQTSNCIHDEIYGSQVTLDTSTCKNICSTCSGTITVPIGYVSSNGNTIVTKQPLVGCAEPDDSTGIRKYIRKCSCSTSSTVTCDTANGYSGTATFDGSRFSGCTKGGGIIIPVPICDKGEYLNNNSCEPCPSFNGVAGTTELLNATKITFCYIPSGNTFTDETGTYTLTDDCYYTE